MVRRTGEYRMSRLPDEKLPSRLAVRLVFGVQCGIGFMMVLNLLAEHPTPARLVGALTAFAGVFVLQVLHCLPASQPFRDRYGRLSLAVQSALTFLPLVFGGLNWGGMAGFLAGSTLLLLKPRVAWVLFGLETAFTGLVAALLSGDALGVAWLTMSTVVIGLIVYGLTRVAELVAELHRVRAEVTRLAVEGERLRVARDLHDLLGYSLSAIMLKNELTYRLMGRNDERARVELSEALAITRQALADVRGVAWGYRDMRLADELDSVHGVLTAAGVTTVVEPLVEVGSAEVNTVLATVLREGVTNLLRHSEVRHCRISIRGRGGRIRLTLSNDGVVAKRARGRRRRGGLDNLTQRVERIGGSLTSIVDSDGWFHVVADCPVEPGRSVTVSSRCPERFEPRPADFAH
ncbi:sensor histidine kinase [Kitasatospora sp. NPDC053057]|uniref:sensor histidine kinase n=1 Tax=Kitasatospora sp. NPDC053057 TaxID=3364062 RepID=UPI0037C764FD